MTRITPTLPSPVKGEGVFSWKSEFRRSLSLLLRKLRTCGKALREILYGMTIHEMDVGFRKERGDLNHLFMLIVFGDLVGLPLLPPYYSMRLLPYILPGLRTWKRSLLRERDLTDLASIDL